MKIGIVGAGNVGGGMAKAAVAAGHQVSVSAASPEHAASVAEATGARAAKDNHDAVAGAEVVVLAVPASVAGEVVAQLGSALDGVTLVDATNPLNASFSDLAIEGTSAGQDLQAKAPRAHVVKAFNTVFASRYAQPSENGVKLDAYLAGDDEAAKARVAEYAASLGFHPVDAGGLRMARSLEEMAFLNITLNARNNWVWQSGWKLTGPTAAS
jgi:8-hydroxy-5-deazaflavin:NADPH oxidoreductase